MHVVCGAHVTQEVKAWSLACQEISGGAGHAVSAERLCRRAVVRGEEGPEGGEAVVHVGNVGVCDLEESEGGRVDGEANGVEQRADAGCDARRRITTDLSELTSRYKSLERDL